MTNAEIKKSLEAAVNTLNVVEVKGKDNMNHLLGVILMLSELANYLGQSETKAEEVTPNEENPTE